MQSLRLFSKALLLGLFIGCGPDLCEDVDCGPGTCFDGNCECPDGFSGDNCEIEFCFGVDCINGNCDPQTETCICDPNYYGESCDKQCINGDFENGMCNCSDGFEGLACEIESRCRYMGWWGCSQWTMASQIGGVPTPGFLPGSIKFEEGYYINEVELFPTNNSDGLMLLNSNQRIVGKVNKNKINFELQYLTTERTVYGTASLGTNRVLTIELFLFNPTTSLTEVAKGTFTLTRYIKQ